MRRSWVITDTHFGIKNFNRDWLEDNQLKFFYEQFIPHVKKNKKDGDVLIHCGDVFDHRLILNIYSLNKVIELFENLCTIFDKVYVIAGNHDIYNKSTNDINSLKCIKYIPGMIVLEEEPKVILTDGGKKIAMMPWNETVEEEEKDLDGLGHCDYIFCHTTIKGSMFNKSVVVQDGVDSESFKKFRYVRSGHIHYKSGNYLGCPYEMDRNDINNPKGFYLFDFENETEEFIENTVSSKHIRLTIDDLENPDISERIKNNFVDITVSTDLKNSVELTKISESLASSKSLKMVFVDEEHLKRLEEMKKVDMEVGVYDIETSNLIELYVENTEYNTPLKQKLKEYLKSLYKRSSGEN